MEISAHVHWGMSDRTWGANTHFGVSEHFIINLYFVFRENKNRWVLSFLCALVQLDVFLEVQFQFLMVGHTGKLYLAKRALLGTGEAPGLVI